MRTEFQKIIIITVAILLKCKVIFLFVEKKRQFVHIIIIFYTNIRTLIVMKVTSKKEELPLLLVVTVSLITAGTIVTAAAEGSIFFSVTPAAFADDLTAEDILSLKDPGQRKVTICHIPNGNPANAHEITVGESAVAAHIIHGDTIGPCQPQE
jgi:hypothetical protein